MVHYKRMHSKGFTIVELLIVVVVIAILAAITIIGYNGIQNRAKASAVQSAVSQYAKKIEEAKANLANERYPSSLSAVGITLPSNATYSVNTTAKGYCIVVNDGNTSYFMTQSITQPRAGSCTTFDGLIAWWPFNNSPEDISGNSLNGTPAGVTSGVGHNGQAGSAYYFDGSSQVICPSDELLRPETGLSLSVWVYMTANSTSMNGIFNYGVGGYWLSVHSTLEPVFYTTSSNLTAPTVNLNEWYHFVATYNSGQRVLYVNGVQVANNNGPTTITGYGGESCRIGNIKNVSNRYFTGQIDDLRIFNRPLTAPEAQALYVNGSY